MDMRGKEGGVGGGAGGMDMRENLTEEWGKVAEVSIDRGKGWFWFLEGLMRGLGLSRNFPTKQLIPTRFSKLLEPTASYF